MKTTIKHLLGAAFLTLIFLGGNVNAKGTEVTVSGHENIIEETLILEDWMVNENYWNYSDSEFEIVELNDEELYLEDWMTNETLWNKSYFTEIEGETLALEGWMFDEENWNTKIEVDFEEEVEPVATLENWMINDLVWFR